MKKLQSLGGAALFICFTCSCATVVSDQLPAKVSPSGHNRGEVGKVAYNHNGLSEIVRLRKQEAFEKIVEICGSNEYEVISETVEKTADHFSGVALFGTNTAMVIEFRCK